MELVIVAIIVIFIALYNQVIDTRSFINDVKMGSGTGTNKRALRPGKTAGTFLYGGPENAVFAGDLDGKDAFTGTGKGHNGGNEPQLPRQLQRLDV